MICQMLDWGASDFGTDLGRCHFIGAVQKEEESIKVREGEEDGGNGIKIMAVAESKSFLFLQYLITQMKMKIIYEPNSDDLDRCARVNSRKKPRPSADNGCRGQNL